MSWGSDKVPSAIEPGDNQRPEQAGAGAKIFALSLPSPAKNRNGDGRLRKTNLTTPDPVRSGRVLHSQFHLYIIR